MHKHAQRCSPHKHVLFVVAFRILAYLCGIVCCRVFQGTAWSNSLSSSTPFQVTCGCTCCCVHAHVDAQVHQHEDAHVDEEEHEKNTKMHKANPSDGLTHISSEFHGHMAQLRQTFTATDPRVRILAEGVLESCHPSSICHLPVASAQVCLPLTFVHLAQDKR